MAKILFLKKLCLKKKGVSFVQKSFDKFQEDESQWNQIKEGNYNTHCAGENSYKGAWASRDASGWKFGDFQRSGKQAPRVTDRVIIWGSAAEAIRSVDHLPSSSPMPLPLLGNEQPMCQAGRVNERRGGAFGDCDKQVNR